MRKAFTLIELLIVVAIIAILAAIAVPNFLEAQTRAKVARAKADMRTIITGVVGYQVDNNAYPLGTDNRDKIPEKITDFLTPMNLDGGFYTFQTRELGGGLVGRDFGGITTPIAYLTSVPTDPFAGHAAGFLTYCYRPAVLRKTGFILTSVGPDTDLLAAGGIGNNNTINPLSTRQDTAGKKRMADINERMVIQFIEGDAPSAYQAEIPHLRSHLEDLTYDPTNGTISDGDLARLGP